MLAATLLYLATLATPAADHDDKNPLYRALRKEGLAVGAQTVKLPTPSMADGLDAAAQARVLKEVAGDAYDVEDLLRKSQVAPHVLRLRDVTPSDADIPARGVDVWFIAYGDLKKLSSKDFLQKLKPSRAEEGKAETISAEALKKRGITIKAEDDKHESYGRLTFSLIDRVQLEVTGHGYWSETADSVVMVSRLDDRFRDDKDYPNRWRPLSRNPEGKLEPGQTHPYSGAAYYLKVTRLAKPEGALFVEVHVVFGEPKKWFDGANLLRSKLPAGVQGQVRSFRRELAR